MRGNLSRIVNDFRNVQLAIQWDCHDFANAKSRNDRENARLAKTRDYHDLPLASLAMTESRFFLVVLRAF